MDHSKLAPTSPTPFASFDRRSFPRVSVQAPVLITDEHCHSEAGHCLDLSPGGMRMTPAAHLPEGSIVEVWIELDSGLSLDCEAEVASNDTLGTGLRFLGMDAQQGARLAHYLGVASAA